MAWCLFILRFVVVDVWFESSSYGSEVFVAGTDHVLNGGLLGLTKIAGLLLFDDAKIVAPRDILVEGWTQQLSA